MIQMQSNLEVADNSGAKKVQCIKVIGGSKKMVASVGDIIIVSIKDVQRFPAPWLLRISYGAVLPSSQRSEPKSLYL